MTATFQAPGLEGRRIGRYELKCKIAQGGMAVVYLGQLTGGHGFEKSVAVKVMHSHLIDDRRFVDMFLDEARLVARIEHPNVCSVIDFGEEDGLLYLVMEYLHGESLSSVVRRAVKGGGMPRWLAARVVADVARGLHAAHEQRDSKGEPLQIVHRDVSPQNVHVLYDGISKIVDFGVARARGRLASTSSGELKGKFSYMSPEQLQGGAVDRRTDVWALGVVLWEATLGKRLFRGDSQGQTAIAVLQQPIPAPSELSADYPAKLERAVMGALQRNADERTPTAAVLADELERYLKEEPELSGPAQVQQWMAETFADRRDIREELLQSDVSAIPLDDKDLVDSKSTLGSLRAEEPENEPAAAPTAATTAEATSQATPKARGKWMTLGLGAAALVLLAGGGWWMSRIGAEDDRDPETVSSTPDTDESGDETGPPVAAGLAGEGSRGDEEEGAAPAKSEDQDETSDSDRDEASDSDRESELAGGGTSGNEDETASDEAKTEEDRSSDSDGHRRARVPPGKLSLLAIPAAEVTRRGRSLGTTPLIDVPLPAGRHRLTLRTVSGGATKNITVTIKPRRSTRRTVRLSE